MSALPSKADMCSATRDVCFGPKADMCGSPVMSEGKRLSGLLRSLGSSFRGPCVSWAVVWQTRPIAITANKEARRLLRPRFKTVFTGYLIIRLGADVTVNQHFAFRHHCGQHSYVLRFGTLEFNQIFFRDFATADPSPQARHMRGILIARHRTLSEYHRR